MAEDSNRWRLEQICSMSDDDWRQNVLTVVDLERYIIDPVFWQQTGLTAYNAYDAYDLTVANNTHQRKMVLSCTLNNLVQKKRIYPGSRIRLTRVNMRCDETVLTGSVIPIVENLTFVDDGYVTDLSVLSRLPWYPKDGACQQESQPLASGRGYYLDIWSNCDVAKTADNFQVIESNSLRGLDSHDLYSLRELTTRWQVLKAAKPRLLLRVLKRSKLLQYARTAVKDKWPFQLQLVVADETGCCIAVFWNVMASRYLPYLQEGRIILLRNFTVKRRFKTPDHSVLQPPGLPWYDVDLNINAHHPSTEVMLLESSVLEDLRDVNLPLPVANFVTRMQLGSLPDGYSCDVAGVVTFVGAIQREQVKAKTGNDRRGFWIKRWIHIQNSTSEQPVIIQLYRGVEKEEFEVGLSLGRFFIGRNMRVVHQINQIQTSRQLRHVYLTSSRDTQIYVHDCAEAVDYPFESNAALRLAQQIAVSAELEQKRSGSLMDMFFSFPPLPTSLGSFTALCKNLELTPSDTWKTFLENLSYRESVHIVIQAQLLAVSFHRATTQRKSKRLLEVQKEDQASGSVSEDLSSDFQYLGQNPVISETSSICEDESFFIVQWQGLNAKVILNTIKLCNLHSCPSDLTLQTLLSGAFEARPGESVEQPSEIVVKRIVGSLTSRNIYKLPWFLVILNVFCEDGEKVLLGVERAFPTDAC